MRLLATVATVSAIAGTALALGALPFRATLTAGTHHPAINTRWPYAVKVVDAKGHPLAARITVNIIDPLGGVNPVEFNASKKLVKNIPFRGTFRDAVKWPPESKGYPLTFRVTVKVGAAKKVLKYPVVSG